MWQVFHFKEKDGLEIQDPVYDFLRDLTKTYGAIFCFIPEFSTSIKAVANNIPLKFEANFIIKGKKPREFYSFISPSGRILRKGINRSCNLNFIGPDKIWIAILSGEETLLGAFNAGLIKMTQVRENYIIRMAMYSEFISGLVRRRARLRRAGNILSLLPKTPVRDFLSIVLTIIRVISTLK